MGGGAVGRVLSLRRGDASLPSASAMPAGVSEHAPPGCSERIRREPFERCTRV